MQLAIVLCSVPAERGRACGHPPRAGAACRAPQLSLSLYAPTSIHVFIRSQAAGGHASAQRANTVIWAHSHQFQPTLALHRSQLAYGLMTRRRGASCTSCICLGALLAIAAASTAATILMLQQWRAGLSSSSAAAPARAAQAPPLPPPLHGAALLQAVRAAAAAHRAGPMHVAGQHAQVHGAGLHAAAGRPPPPHQPAAVRRVGGAVRAAPQGHPRGPRATEVQHHAQQARVWQW